MTKEEHRLVGKEAIKQFIDDHPEAIWVTHNGLEFDVPTLNRLLRTNIKPTKVVDTFVLSMLYHPTLPGGHSLADWAKRVGMEKIEFNDWTHYSDEMGEYCLGASRLPAAVFRSLAKRMRDIGFTEVGCSIENRA